MVRIHQWKAGMLILALGAFAIPAHAQLGGLGGRLKDKVKQRIDQKADQAMDDALNQVECVATDTRCIEQAKKDGKEVKTVEGAAAQKPGEGAWVNYDFVPGSRPLFVEDFSKDAVGDFPRRLEFGDGNMEVAEWRGGRYLRVTSWPGKVAINLPETLPERFTLEFDATPGYNANWTIFRFSDDPADDVRFRIYGGKGQGGVFGAKHQQQGATSGPIGETEVYRGRIMADGKYVKVYMNETRVANIPNAELGRSRKITIEIPGTQESPVFLGNLTVMAGGKKLYDALSETGRIATQGIYFDTGSDRIRPESTPTLVEIGTMLKEHPDLQLTIEGHTDNVGSAESNQALSERRAQSVRRYLIETYGVTEARLEAKGLGASKPAAANDTPEGRKQNRRVELVKR